MGREKGSETMIRCWCFMRMVLTDFFHFTYGLCDFILTSQQKKEKFSRQAFAR